MGIDEMWNDVKYLTNEERDQIDLQVRMILARCAQKVRDMEELEKRESMFKFTVLCFSDCLGSVRLVCAMMTGIGIRGTGYPTHGKPLAT